MNIERVPLERQLELADKHFNAAYDIVETMLSDYREVIRRRMLRRVRTEGAAVYGDKTWHLCIPQIQMELTDELCDAVFYGAVISALETDDV